VKRRYLIVGLAILPLSVLIWRPWQSPFDSHFTFPLPDTAKVVGYQRTWAGLDSADDFAFAVTSDALRDAIIKEWKLEPAVRTSDAESFAKVVGGPAWWPGSTLDQLPERYGRKDQVRTKYWSLWVDRENGKLYAECGDW